MHIYKLLFDTCYKISSQIVKQEHFVPFFRDIV